MSLKVSIIVPVYNAEKYLNRCIDSILAQKFTDIELLLVDDGSTDNSGVICDEYVAKDERIRVFHKENGGVTSARRLGLEKSKGIWVSFVDADDELYNDSIDILYANIDNCDMVIGGGWTSINKIITANEYVKLTLSGKLPNSIWGRLYRKSIIENQMDDISRKLIVGEDVILNILIGVNFNGNVKLIKDDVYRYYQNDNSVMNTRKVSLDYERYYIETLRKALGKKFGDYKNEFYTSCLCTLENLIVCKIEVPYNKNWVREILYWNRNKKLTFRQWCVVNIRHQLLCRYILSAERRINNLVKIICPRYQ